MRFAFPIVREGHAPVVAVLGGEMPPGDGWHRCSFETLFSAACVHIPDVLEAVASIAPDAPLDYQTSLSVWTAEPILDSPTGPSFGLALFLHLVGRARVPRRGADIVLATGAIVHPGVVGSVDDGDFENKVGLLFENGALCRVLLCPSSNWHGSGFSRRTSEARLTRAFFGVSSGTSENEPELNVFSVHDLSELPIHGRRTLVLVPQTGNALKQLTDSMFWPGSASGLEGSLARSIECLQALLSSVAASHVVLIVWLAKGFSRRLGYIGSLQTVVCSSLVIGAVSSAWIFELFWGSLRTSSAQSVGESPENWAFAAGSERSTGMLTVLALCTLTSAQAAIWSYVILNSIRSEVTLGAAVLAAMFVSVLRSYFSAFLALGIGRKSRLGWSPPSIGLRFVWRSFGPAYGQAFLLLLATTYPRSLLAWAILSMFPILFNPASAEGRVAVRMARYALNAIPLIMILGMFVLGHPLVQGTDSPIALRLLESLSPGVFFVCFLLLLAASALAIRRLEQALACVFTLRTRLLSERSLRTR